MQDRVPLYPGRVTLTPVSGQPNTFDLVRADQPTQEGTPLNKESLLKDATAKLFGLDANAVPDDALAVLSRFHKGMGNEYVWEKIRIENTVEIDTATNSQDIGYTSTSDRWSYSDTVAVENGVVVLVAPQSSVGLSEAAFVSILAGKYISYNGGPVWYVRTAKGQNGSILLTYNTTRAVSTQTSYGYVNSPDPNAYPPSVSDGYTYTALGKLGSKTRIATGSYTGTGTYGASNPNSLTFDFEPRFLYISGYSEWAIMNPLIRPTSTTGQSSPGAVFEYGTKVDALYSVYSDTATVFKWINRNNAGRQMNFSGITYYYLAIE